MVQVTTDRYVIVDKDGNPLRDELETRGLLVLNTMYEAADCIEWLIGDSLDNAFRGLRIETYDAQLHGSENE
jgi:hypothetical protein